MTTLQNEALRAVAKALEPLPPGSVVPSERQLASQGGVSRTVIREILSHLARRKAVARRGKAWIYVRAPARPASPQPAEARPRRQKVQDFLMAELSSGRLAPGSLVSELSLARKLKVATISVREALLEMQPLGLLTKKERQRWKVTAFTPAYLQDLREFREMAETFALRKICAAPLPAALRASFERNRDAIVRLGGLRRPSLAAILRTDLDFHRLLLEASGNAVLRERAEFIYLIIEFALTGPQASLERALFGLTQHHGIISALLEGEHDQAEILLKEHLRSAEHALCALISRRDLG